MCIPRLVVTAAVGLILALTGCSSGDSDSVDAGQASPPVSGTPSESASDGSDPANEQDELHDGVLGGSAQGVQMELPAGWVELDPDSDDLEAGLSALGIEGEASDIMRAGIEQLTALDAAFAVHARSVFTSPNHYGTTVNAYCVPEGGLSTDDLRTGIEIGITALGAEDMQFADTTVDGHPAVKTTYLLPTPQLTVQGVQWAFGTNSQTCFVTFFTDRADEFEDSFEEMAETIRPV